MIDNRLLTWYAVTLGFIIIFPLLRRISNPKNSVFTNSIYKSFLITFISSFLVFYLFIVDRIQSAEFQFLALLIVFVYYFTGFNYSEYSWIGQETKVQSFNISILKRIGKSFGGSKVGGVGDEQSFMITTPYRLKYRIETVLDKENNTGVFVLTSSQGNLQIIKTTNIIALYLIQQAVINNRESVDFPIFNIQTNSVFAVMFTISVSLIILYLEIETGKNLTSSLPVMYTKLLQNEALNKLQGGPGFSRPVDVKGKAQTILDKRKSNVLKAKKEEVEGKLTSVFGEKEEVPLDKKSIARVRLMESVKRILNSTPPWSKVSLLKITELSKGYEEEVEIIIAGLIDLKEVKGIYDIWTKTYHGTSSSHWLITKILNELPDSDTSLENIKIYPDGGGEFSLNRKEK